MKTKILLYKIPFSDSWDLIEDVILPIKEFLSMKFIRFKVLFCPVVGQSFADRLFF
jgi:hypothetical protein